MAEEGHAEGSPQTPTVEEANDWSWEALVDYFVTQIKSPRFWIVLAVFVGTEIVISIGDVDLEWHWLTLYGFLLLGLSSLTNSPRTFFRGDVTEKTAAPQSFSLLAGSSFVTWIFAKSINNSAGLGAKFGGLIGGFAYAGWYLSFFSASLVIYRLRGMGYKSLPEAICARYGRLAALSFGMAVLYRLLNEVWSNAIVVASFYGPTHSTEWWWSAIVSTVIPLAYVFGGGLRMSLTSDLLQAVVMIIFLCIMLGYISSNNERSFLTWRGAGTCAGGQDLNETACLAAMQGLEFTKAATFKAGSCKFAAPYKNTMLWASSSIATEAQCTSSGGVWTADKCTLNNRWSCEEVTGNTWDSVDVSALSAGWDILVVAVLQGSLSYPFYDPVLTDRCFLGPRKVMRSAFITGGSIAAAFIVCFGMYGSYGRIEATYEPASVGAKLYSGMVAGTSADIARSMGDGLYQVIAIIFITSSISTLDSTFSSCAKICGPEFAGLLLKGRPEVPENANRWHLFLGRIAMVVLAIAGLLHLVDDVKELSATTVSGTMVMGLGPPVMALLVLDPADKNSYRPLLFHMPFWCGVAFGITYQLQKDDCCKDWMQTDGFDIGNGIYNRLLGFNIYGHMCCWALACLTAFEHPLGWPRVDWVCAGIKRCFGVGTEDVDDEDVPEMVAAQPDLEKVIKPTEPAADSDPVVVADAADAQ
eukprot:TRINITY_DN579_c0_g1_i1.p1 TRINITY_DN579_c0_g1~~TRINITY_DN579_c0_g1_i1.p1  ORF type:complete len:699 (+),score=276.09 TRINITY_DN579_c0_g1_i1:81-2177(+)